MNNFQRGDLAGGAKWQPLNGQNNTLNIKGLSFDEECLRFDVTNTGTGGRTARISGKCDIKGSINATLDLDQPPYLSPVSLRTSTAGILLLYINPSRPVQVPALVTKTHYEYTVESEVRYSFDFEEASNYGSVVFPAT